uniref:SAC3/GANP family domain containing protein n=2 Tax=Babesia bovis TaxID=5865 RepID=A7AWW4_BABBO|eukprot:XP_001609110.1 SAC3/GANP family domain containing protein [Babesia bovis T2Bo]
MKDVNETLKRRCAPSYNMLFAYFKQQGYSDELAGSEARKRMNQGESPGLQGITVPAVQQVGLGSNSVYDRASLLRGVKIKPKEMEQAWRIPLSTTPAPKNKIAAKNKIPITLKISKTKQATLSKHEHGENREIPNDNGPNKDPVGVKTSSIIANHFSHDVEIGPAEPVSHPKRTVDASAPTMDDINKWIQKLYAQHSMGACSRAFRTKISEFVESIVQKYRNGTLKFKDMVIPNADDIMSGHINTKQNSDTSETELKQTNDKHRTHDSSMKTTKQKINSQWKRGDNELYGVDCPRIQRVRPVETNSGDGKKQQRSERFKSFANTQSVYNFSPKKGVAIVGVCEALEKPYLRLTAEPNPATVRPEHVLKRAFRHVFDEFMKTGNYKYIEEQFRSIRQDIQVQHIRSPFVAKLYATNARVALIYGDLDQFNQCQTQLRQLNCQLNDMPHYRLEFECYFMMYLAMQNMQMGMLRYLRILTSEFKNTSYFIYANKIREVLAEGNFVEYFKMADTSQMEAIRCLEDVYNDAFSTDDFSEGLTYRDVTAAEMNTTITKPPFFSQFLFKMFEPRFRMDALVNMAKTAMFLSVDTVKDVLRFVSTKECESFIT